MSTPSKHEYINPTRELRDAWDLLLSRYPWEWFVTLTFTDHIHDESAEKRFRLWISMLNRDLFGPRWYKKPGGGVYWARARELQKRGVIHYHILISGVGDTRRLTWMDKWFELGGNTGFARIESVNNQIAVNRYLTKYVAKDGQIDLSPNLKDISQDLLADIEL